MSRPERRVVKPWHHHLRVILFVPVLLTAWFLPARAQRRLARVTARFVHVLAPRLRARLEKNLSRALGGGAPPARLKEAVLAALVNYGDYLLDFLALQRRRRRGLLRSSAGAERLQAAAAQGRGVILATAHLGSWEMAALFLSDEARTLTLVSAPEEIAYLGALRSAIRSEQRHGELLVGRDPMAVLALLEKLRAGGMVGMQLDRAVGDSYASVPFCGARLRMPRGPARLALASDAFVVPVFALFAQGGGYDLVIEEPIDPRGRTEEELLARFAAVLERYVRAHPEQWLMMQDPWDDASASAGEEDLRAAPAAGAVA
jgi:KDO2-lipid IV(A) lauroyltransferase